MLRRILIPVIVILITGLAACGPRSSKSWHSTTFDNPPGPNGPKKPAANSDEDVEIDDQETAAPLTIQDEKKADIPAYQMPAPLREVLQKEIPQYVASESSEFQVTNPHLNISAKNSTMTFSGVLKLKGRAEEPFELSCKFDKAKLWVCPDMFPTNEAVAKERRLQATVNCADSYRCQKVGLELFVRIGDRTESQLFQSTKFEMRRASSGDIAAYEKSETPAAGQGQPPKAEEAALTEEEFKKIADDSNAAIEIVAPMPVPNPSAGNFSIPGIEKLKPEIGKGVPNQAIGSHSDGHLEKAAHLDKQGTGYRVRDGADRAFGTDLMIGLIKGAADKMEAAKPGQAPLVIADISKQTGGRLANRSGRHHASHQTGLDADIVFPSRRPVADMWDVCPTSSSRCRTNAKISDQLDEERLWTVLTSMTCAEKNPVIALFLDTEIKKHLCRWASSRFGGELSDSNSCAFRTLRAMKYSEGHYNHVHVRLRCPGNADCRDATVSLGKGTGC